MTIASTFSPALLSLLVALSPTLGAQTPAATHLQKAHQYLQSRQPELARSEFAAASAADPANLDAQANLGVLLYFAADFAEAASHLRAALQLDPTQFKLQALLGLSERRTGNSAQARTDLQASLARLTDDKIRKQAGLELLELEVAANDLPAAAETVSALKAALPTDPEVLYAAYRTYTDLAGESLLSLSLAGPNSAQIHQAIAHELIKARDNPAAITNLRAALALDPHLPGAHFELAELLASSSSPELKAEAVKQYQLALEDNPRDDKTMTHLGDLAAASSDHEAAIDRYRQALALQPENSDASIGLAHELVETGHPDVALPLLLAAIKSDPSNLLAHYRLSALYRRLHRPDDAKREIAEYERLKETKDKLRGVYDALRMSSPQTDDPKN